MEKLIVMDFDVMDPHRNIRETKEEGKRFIGKYDTPIKCNNACTNQTTEISLAFLKGPTLAPRVAVLIL